jgi:hypothetical protein
MIQASSHRLKRLVEQREKLDARIQATEARIKNSERKKDIRRKILIGAYYLDIAAKENKMDMIKSIIDRYLTRNSDRILFDLEPLVENKEKEPENKA